MPELPEVQTMADDLNKRLKGCSIVGVWCDWPKMIKYPASERAFKKLVRDSKIKKVERRAKYVKFHLDKDKLMLIHPKMTGHFLFVPKGRPAKYVHLSLHLDNGKMLAFSDVRKFGTVRAGKIEEIENLPEIKKLGPEPLDHKFKFHDFVKVIKSRRRKIKQALMDPEIIAGIGNIYSDEVLWLARIHPFRLTTRLAEVELKSLWIAIRKVLKKSLHLRGTSSRDYRDIDGKKGSYYDQRLVYGREKEACKRCSKKIKRTRMNGRSAHFCAHCQKM